MYQIPIKAIKSILLKEHESFMQSTRGISPYMRLDYPRYLLDVASEVTINAIQSCDSYQELEDFISDSRRMSLQDWIDSL